MTQVNTDYPGIITFANMPFDATNFTGNNSMTWTVGPSDVGCYRWALSGNLLYLVLKIGGVVGGTPSTKLMVRLPNGLKSKNAVNFITEVNSFGTGNQFGFSDVAAADNKINFQTSLASPFANWGAGATEVNFQGAIEIGG